MSPGDLYRKLRKLNHRIRIYCKDGSEVAGVYLVSRNGCEIDHICGIDTNDVPQHVSYNEDGSIHKGGWRRLLKILIQKRVIDRFAAQRVFSTHLEYRPSQRKHQEAALKSQDEMNARAEEIVRKYQ